MTVIPDKSKAGFEKFQSFDSRCSSTSQWIFLDPGRGGGPDGRRGLHREAAQPLPRGLPVQYPRGGTGTEIRTYAQRFNGEWQVKQNVPT
jgi:hypothetical protein